MRSKCGPTGASDVMPEIALSRSRIYTANAPPGSDTPAGVTDGVTSGLEASSRYPGAERSAGEPVTASAGDMTVVPLTAGFTTRCNSKVLSDSDI